MKKIIIISASVRSQRHSHRVALFFHQQISNQNGYIVELLDLKEYNFPLFEERLQFLNNPTEEVLAFANKISNADGIIIVTPEYNGGYPASLKNAIDLLYNEWKRKPIGIATVSAGSFGGSQVITSLVFSLWKIGALMIPATFAVPQITQAFTEEGNPTDEINTVKRAKKFIDELDYWIKASAKDLT